MEQYLRKTFRLEIIKELSAETKTRSEMILDLQEKVRSFFNAHPELKDHEGFYWLMNRSELTVRRGLGFSNDGYQKSIETTVIDALALVFERKKKKLLVTHVFTPLRNSEKRKTSQKIASAKTQGVISSYKNAVKDSFSESAMTHRFEDAMIAIISKLTQADTKDLTIVTDDISFVFKAMPTLAYFLSQEGNRMCLLFCPKHAYSLLNGKEFLALYKMGVDIRVLDIKDTFKVHGFYFNYFPDDPSVKNLNIELYRIRSNIFDKGALITFSLSIDSMDKSVEEGLKDIEAKIKGMAMVGSFKPLRVKMIGQEYRENMVQKFASWNKIQEKAPLYQTELVGKRALRFDYEVIDFQNVYFRKERLVAYKVFQAQALIEKGNFICNLRGDLASFKTLSLFENPNGHYAINPPVVEYNAAENRYEIAEGHSRLFAIFMLGTIKRIEVIVAKNLSEKAFMLSKDFVHKKDVVVSNDWSLLKISTDHFSEPLISRFPRNIESVTHQFLPDDYRELADKLVACNILSSRKEANRFINNEAKFSES